MNSYKQHTKHFDIPVPGWNDSLWPELELKKWQMVENMLMSAMRGNVNAVFNEGDLRLRQEADGTYTVTLSAVSASSAVKGTVGGAFFDIPSTVAWKGLQVGFPYYLYIKGSAKTFQDEESVEPVASQTRLATQYVTLIAKADLTAENPSIDRYPPGKVNARDLAQHVLDFENPHGEKMVQDELLVNKRLAIGDGNDAVLELDVNGETNSFPVSKLVTALSTSRTIVDFTSNGKTGVVLSGNGRVLFASVSRTDKSDRVLGEVTVGYFGIDPDVQLPDQVIVYNTEYIGVTMRAMLICQG